MKEPATWEMKEPATWAGSSASPKLCVLLVDVHEPVGASANHNHGGDCPQEEDHRHDALLLFTAIGERITLSAPREFLFVRYLHAVIVG